MTARKGKSAGSTTKRSKRNIKLSRTILWDELYPWRASGPGWENWGITIPVRVLEIKDGVHQHRIESETFYIDQLDVDPEIFRASLILHAALVRVAKTAKPREHR